MNEAEHYHTFGHHPDDRDPWDALLMDVTALDDSGEYKALVSFWRKKGQASEEGAPGTFARGNHKVGYRGVLVCPHRHLTTQEARACVAGGAS